MDSGLIQICRKKKESSLTDNDVSAQDLVIGHSSASPQCFCQFLLSGQTTVNVMLQRVAQSNTSYTNAKKVFKHVTSPLWFTLVQTRERQFTVI